MRGLGNGNPDVEQGWGAQGRPFYLEELDHWWSRGVTTGWSSAFERVSVPGPVNPGSLLGGTGDRWGGSNFGSVCSWKDI